MRHRLMSSTLAVLLLASGCGAAAHEDHGAAATSSAAGSAAASQASPATVVDASGASTKVPTVNDPLLEKYDMNGKTVTEVIAAMDTTNAHRGSGLNGSVRADHLLLTDEQAGTKAEIPLPADRFYVSVAPYATKTHDCFNHSLTGCVGEYAGAPMQAKITQDDGKVLYDGPVTTFENGFVGFWLPRDVKGTMSFTYEGKTAQGPFATDAKSPTCITTLQFT